MEAALPAPATVRRTARPCCPLLPPSRIPLPAHIHIPLPTHVHIPLTSTPCIPLAFTSVPASVRPCPPSCCPLVPASRSHPHPAPAGPCICIPHPTGPCNCIPRPAARSQPHPAAAEQRTRGGHPSPCIWAHADPGPRGPPAAPSPTAPVPSANRAGATRPSQRPQGHREGTRVPAARNRVTSFHTITVLAWVSPSPGTVQAKAPPSPPACCPPSLCPHATAGTGGTLSTGDPRVPEHQGTPESLDSLQTRPPPGHIPGQR